MEKWESGKVGKWKNGKIESGKVEKWKSGKVEKWKETHSKEKNRTKRLKEPTTNTHTHTHAAITQLSSWVFRVPHSISIVPNVK